MIEFSDLALQRLTQIEFFAKVGTGNSDVISGCKTVTVSTWDEAVKLRGSEIASDAFTEARGRLTRKLGSDFRKDYKEWNKIANKNRELFEKYLFPKIDKSINAIPDLKHIEHGQELLKDFIRWDIMHYAAEQAYADLVLPQFYSSIISIYEAGHFPCDWNEIWPDGEIVIY